MKWILFSLIAFQWGLVQGQWLQSLDSVSMWIGDQQNLTIQSSSQVSEEVFQVIDTLSWLTILDKGQWIKLSDQNYERKIKFTVFDSGYYRFPYILKPEDSTGVQQIMLRVMPYPDSSSTLQGIKNIIETEGKNYFWILVIGTILFVLFTSILLFFFFKADRKQSTIIEYEKKYSASEIALRSIEELEKQKLWQSGFSKEYFDQLNLILRSYISNGLFVPALEMNSIEIIQELESKEEQIKMLDELSPQLRMTDLVKFAQHKVDPQTHFDAMNFVQKFVAQNASLSKQEEEKHKVIWSSYLTNDQAQQFEYPQEEVPEQIQALKFEHEVQRIYLVGTLLNINSFHLPNHLIKLHHKNLGLLSKWQINMLSQQDHKILYKILFGLLIPLIALILPVLWISALMKKENLFGRGIFSQSKHGKLLLKRKSFDK